MVDTITLRKTLMQKGYSPIPLEGKLPALKAWEQKIKSNDEEITLWDKLYSRAENTGVLTRLMPTIDIDIKNEAAAKAVEDLAREVFEERGYLLVRIGEPPKRAIPLRTSTPFKKIVSNLTAPNGATEKIELLCDGQQVVVFGIHPGTLKPYFWHGGDPSIIELESLPYVSQEQAQAFVYAATELLIADFGYTAVAARPTSAPAGANGRPAASDDWAWLVRNILDGHELHDSSTTLAAKFLSSGMSDGAAVNCLRGMFEASSIPHDDRWKQRFDDLPRAVTSARRKIGDASPPTPQQSPKQPYESKAASLAPLPPIMPKATFLGCYNTLANYLVDDVLQYAFIYALTGQTGHAKTAVALLIARLVASADQNAALGFHKVAKGRVLYLVGENPDDVSIRIRGSDATREDNPDDDNISFVPGIFDIERMMAIIEADTRRNGALSLIIVDTSAAYFLGNEELSNTQMGGYARVLRKLTTLPGRPCVLVLCHPIKHVIEPSQLLPRGGSAYLAEMDGNLTLWRTAEDMVVLDHTKLRGPDFQPITFQLKQIKTPKLLDAKGRQISTIEAAVISTKEEDAVENRDTEEEDRVLAAMLQEEFGSFTTWAQALGWVDGKGEPYKKRVERVVARLAQMKPKLVTKNRKLWILTEEGKEQARKAGLRFLRDAPPVTEERQF